MRNYYKLFLIAILFVPKFVEAQCIYGAANQFPAATIVAPTVLGTVLPIAPNSFYGEHAIISGMLAGNTYEITVNASTVAGAPQGYITIFDAGGVNIIASGPAPFSFVPTVSADYETQWNDDGVLCGSDFTSHLTSITFLNSPLCFGPVVAGTSSSTPAGACLGVNFSLNLAGTTTGSGLTFQWQKSTTGLAGSFTNIAGATTPSYTSQQTVQSFYRCYVSCSAGVADTSTVTQVNMNAFSSCYAAPVSAGSACINNVTISALNNTTPACAVGNYSTQAATTNLIVGGTYPITVSTSSAAIVSVWIDYNQSGTFDASEWTQVYTTGLTGTAAITVNAAALAGNTGMRIRSRSSGNQNGNLDAQTNFGSGECEDYVVNLVIPNCPSVTGITQNALTAFTSNVSWNAAAATQWKIYWGTPGFTVNGAGQLGQQVVNTTPNYTITGLNPSTTYQAKVRAICGALDTSFVSPGFTTITPATCPPPTLFSATSTAVATTKTLNWIPGGGETMWEVSYGTPGFTINGAGELGSQIYSAAPPQTLSGLLPNTFYQAKLRAICSPGDTSFATAFISFNTFANGNFIQNDNVCIPFVSIAANPAAVALATTDDSEVGFTLPFQFYYQGAPVSNITIGNNGGIVFNTLTGNIGYTITTVPFGLFPFVQDMATASAGEGVFRLTSGTAPNRKFTVEWNLQHYFTSPSAARFQVVMEETTGQIYFLYDDVDFGDPLNYDNGLDAEIGITGPQNITLSTNSSTYLTNNSCAHFYYTNCPKPSTPIVGAGTLTATSASIFWSAGLANETDWIVEYGLAGYTAGSAAALGSFDLTSQQVDLIGLTENTDYDVYIYASCTSVLDTSNALFFTFTTLPNCSNPVFPALNPVTTGVDSLNVNWTWAPTVASILNFNVTYVTTGNNPSTGTVAVTDGVPGEVITNPALMNGAVYDVYVQAVCVGFVSDTIGPIQVRMPLAIDSICGAQLLPVDNVARTFHNVGATVQAGENGLIIPTSGYNSNSGWGAPGYFKTTWFKFVAPASGNVRINTTGLNTANKIAVWDVATCSVVTSAVLKGANDDNEATVSTGGASSNFVACGLTAGNTYYIQHSTENNFVNSFYSLKLKAVTPIAGAGLAQLSICYGDSVNLYSRVNGIDSTGAVSSWSDNFNTGNISPTGMFTSAGNASVVYTFTHTVKEGCASDTTKVKIKVVTPPDAGTDGTITTCRSNAINLYSGITSGTTNGVFYNPSNVIVPVNTVSPAFTGSFNYTYIVSSPVCPSDTATIVVTVNACLGIEDQVFEGFTAYPNPTEGILFVTNTSNGELFSYEVTDAKGSVIAFGKDAIATKTEINLSNNERGVYMVRVFNEKSSKVIRVVKM
jgi:GEVED domain/Secretion system C-terminal sorting domain